jgi:hypothetical protein
VTGDASDGWVQVNDASLSGSQTSESCVDELMTGAFGPVASMTYGPAVTAALALPAASTVRTCAYQLPSDSADVVYVVPEAVTGPGAGGVADAVSWTL